MLNAKNQKMFNVVYGVHLKHTQERSLFAACWCCSPGTC